MRRMGNLFERILDRDTLRLAFYRAARGKRGRPEIEAFAADAEGRLAAIAKGLRTAKFPLGRFRQFVIRDPKRRIITAPCFEERVVHHAIVGVCEPVFDRWLIDDTFACRVGKGREAAVVRAAAFASRWPWHLHLDVRQCFDSIPHDRLLELLGRRFKDRQLLDLFNRIVGSFRGSVGRGLPIGSLTSQHFTNFYLGWLDRFVKESLRVRGYVRYMDDLVFWGDDRRSLENVQARCREHLAVTFGLDFKASEPGPSSRGIDFLGCRIRSSHVTLSRRSRRRYRRRVKAIHQACRLGLLDERAAQSRLEAATAFAKAAGTRSWRFRDAVLKSVAVGDP